MKAMQAGVIARMVVVMMLWWNQGMVAGEHPSEVFVRMPSGGGTPSGGTSAADVSGRWISGYGGDTWQVTSSGIAVWARSRVDSTKAAVGWTDFIPVGVPIRVEGGDARPWPVRIYDDGEHAGTELTAWGNVRVYGLSTCDTCYLSVEPRGGELRLGWHGPQWSQPHLGRRGAEVMARAGVPATVAFPSLPSAWYQPEAMPADGELWEPVMVTDPRVLWATYLEPNGTIGFDSRGDLLMMGLPPLMLDVIPITPELIDDSITTRFGRTTKLRPDRTPIWSVWVGGSAQTVMAQNLPRLVTYDRDNNTIEIYESNKVRKRRSYGTYKEAPEPNGDIMLQKWSPEGRLLWNTYVGGSARDVPWVVDTDDEGNIYVAGVTYSKDFPTTANGLLPVKPNHYERDECFLFSLTPDGKQLRWSTYLGALDAEKRIPQDTTLRPYIDIGDMLYDGQGGVLVTMFMWRPTNLPLRKAWQSEPKGGADIYLARIGVDGSLLWGTLVSSPNNEGSYSLSRYTDREFLLRYEMDGRGGGRSYEDYTEPIPSLGVPGYTQTLRDHHDVYLRFTLDGEPTFIWAPNMYLMEYSYMAAPEVLISESIGPSTADAFTDLPKWITSRGAGAKNMGQVTISSVRGHTAITPVFTSQLYGTGVGGDNSYYLSTYHDFVVCGVQSERVNGGAYARGACLTDTIWGAGFGVNTDKRSYAMCFRSPVSLTTPVTGVQDDAGTGVASGATLGPLQVAPHPVRSVLRLNTAVHSVVIRDQLGRVHVQHGDAASPSLSPSPTTTMDVSVLPPGLYALQATGADGTTYTTSFIKE